MSERSFIKATFYLSEFWAFDKPTFFGSDGLAIEVKTDEKQVEVSPIFTRQKNKDINSIIVFRQ
jgi:hypothetical protein